MNFLVTGGAGFIGSHVCERLLRDGHAVWAFDDLNPFYPPALKQANLRELSTVGGGFTFIRGDVTDHEAVDAAVRAAPFDQIIHLAARAGVRASLRDPALYQRVNAEGTARVLDAAQRHGVRKCLLASSSSVYGANARVPFAESDPVAAPISPYAASKLAAEALGHVYHHVYGLDVAVLRFFTVYGSRQRPDLAIHKFTELIDAGKPVPVFGDPDQSGRDYTHVSDIVDGVMGATRQTIGYGIFNLGESQVVRLSRLIALIEQALGKRAVLDRKPPQPGDVPMTCADISKARRELGYAPRVPIEEGIPRFVEWFRRRSPVAAVS